MLFSGKKIEKTKNQRKTGFFFKNNFQKESLITKEYEVPLVGKHVDRQLSFIGDKEIMV